MKELKTTRRTVVRERAVLVEVTLGGDAVGLEGHRNRLEELARLADTAGAQVVATASQRRRDVDPSTYVGRGKADALGRLAAAERAHVIIFDNDLSPAQVRNLEAAAQTKVIDRSELILDIFASRARTNEARLQVELAQLEYLYPRLRRMWTHLSRLEGGGIGARGPGETQLETDRRIVRRRITDLKRKIREIDARKERVVRSRGDRLSVGLVGYTNAGKSSLLNALTNANVYVEDKLFATLDTRTRAWRLPHRLSALLSDTVGFIRDLPHHLVASFKATLEEAVHADLLLHVADVSTEHLAGDVAAVHAVLEEIGCAGKPEVVVLNKCDRVEDPVQLDLAVRRFPGAVLTSATRGDGLEALARTVAERLVGPPREITVGVSPADGRFLAWLEQHSEVLQRSLQDGQIVQRVRLPERLVAEISQRAAGPVRVASEEPGFSIPAAAEPNAP
ncbi:MAG: GTPase HflX [Phycisphaerae bacterium]|nr:GTPase HflX [Phycisphaerae bacterium]